ncbi:MAG: hypothetical protein CMJ39_09835 [Phycisphaerae bacterium]|nr:hypothetical protein [Phycisphaerae bacterium]
MASKHRQSNPKNQRAKARTVASSRAKPTSKPEKIRPQLTASQLRRAQILTIGITLIILAVPMVMAIIRLSNTIPSREAPLLFPPWFTLGALAAIAVVWVNYILWLRRQGSQA